MLEVVLTLISGSQASPESLIWTLHRLRCINTQSSTVKQVVDEDNKHKRGSGKFIPKSTPYCVNALTGSCLSIVWCFNSLNVIFDRATPGGPISCPIEGNPVNLGLVLPQWFNRSLGLDLSAFVRSAYFHPPAYASNLDLNLQNFSLCEG